MTIQRVVAIVRSYYDAELEREKEREGFIANDPDAQRFPDGGYDVSDHALPDWDELRWSQQAAAEEDLQNMLAILMNVIEGPPT